VKLGLAFLAGLAAFAAAYALDRGVYVGSSIYRSTYIQDRLWYDKSCQYFSLSGVDSRQSGGGPTPQSADDNGFCPLFRRPFEFPETLLSAALPSTLFPITGVAGR
jgi:hypothetical protein